MEATILFPIIFMIFFGLVILAMYLPTRSALQYATQGAANALAIEQGDTWLNYDENNLSYKWTGSKSELSNVYVALFKSMGKGDYNTGESLESLLGDSGYAHLIINNGPVRQLNTDNKQIFWIGDGVERDARQAADWFDRAARQGLAPAQWMLGRCYEQGRGVERDARQAVAWYRWAATQGDPEAQYALGVCLDKGLGTEENAAEAFAWYKNAAAQGLKKAQLALADCYEKGRGVPKNSSLARKWRKAAAKD